MGSIAPGPRMGQEPAPKPRNPNVAAAWDRSSKEARMTITIKTTRSQKANISRGRLRLSARPQAALTPAGLDPHDGFRGGLAHGGAAILRGEVRQHGKRLLGRRTDLPQFLNRGDAV